MEGSGAVEALQQQHAAYYLAFAEAADPQLATPARVAWLARLEVEYDNLRAALAWSQAQASRRETGLRLAGALAMFWYIHQHYTEGRQWLEGLLARAGSEVAAEVRATALVGAAVIAWAQGDLANASSRSEESLALFRQLGRTAGSGWALDRMGLVALEKGDYAGAGALAEESLAIFQELGDKRGIAWALNRLGLATLGQGDYEHAAGLLGESLTLFRALGLKEGSGWALHHLGLVAQTQGDYVRGAALLTESLVLFRELDVKFGMAMALNNLGLVAQVQEDHARAAVLHCESLAISHELGDKRRIAWCLVGLAGVAVAQKQAARAARLFGAAEVLREVTGAMLPPSLREVYDQVVLAARS